MYKTALGVVLLLLTAGCRDSSGDDLILLQSGSRQVGTLHGCLNGGCQFNGGTIPQAAIAWIGLHQARADPPQPSDPAAGEIRLTDHSVHPGLMTAIDPTRVIAAHGAYDRQKVAWVYLARPEKAASGNDSDASNVSTSSSDGCRHAIYHYDVHVLGYRRVVEMMNPGFWITGTLSKSFDWMAEWLNVSFSIKQCESTLELLMPAAQGPQHPATGKMHLKYEYDDERRYADGNSKNPFTDLSKPSCHIHKDVWIAANAWLIGGGPISKGARTGLNFDFTTRPDLHRDLGSTQDCPAEANGGRDIYDVITGPDDSKGKDSHAATHEQGTLKPVHGLDWYIGWGTLDLDKQDLPNPPFPIDALIAGKGFSLDSEKQHFNLPKSDSSAEVTDRFVVTITPVGRYRPPDLSNWWNKSANELFAQ
jgi:hypothetical protein